MGTGGSKREWQNLLLHRIYYLEAISKVIYTKKTEIKEMGNSLQHPNQIILCIGICAIPFNSQCRNIFLYLETKMSKDTETCILSLHSQ